MVNIDGVKIIRLIQTDSTNNFLHNYTGEEGEKMTVAITEFQTAGRGQGTNTWESESGKNLLFSVMIRPKNVPAARQFVLLEACALALANALDCRVEGISIKWPNDIYWYDRKMSGTLIECDVSRGMVTRCIMGIGINVNQREFKSDAPNPVSLCNALGTEQKKEDVLQSFLFQLNVCMTLLQDNHFDYIHHEYFDRMYHGDGEYEFEDAQGRFSASIISIANDGHLYLRTSDCHLRKYAFKEVRFIISD